jgi:dienelactone hydrolase
MNRRAPLLLAAAICLPAWLGSFVSADVAVSRPAVAAPASRPAWFGESAEAKRAAFLKLIARPACEPAAKEEASVADPEDDGLIRIGFSFASEPGERVPGLLLKRQQLGGRLPVVIVMHGTGGSKEKEIGNLRRFARRGCIAVAIDGRYHGARADGAGTASYNAAIAKAFADNTGGPADRHPLYFETVWDGMRLIDYLASRHDVDAGRIGVIGFSKGGIETFLLAAADERVAVAVPCIGVQSFAYGLEHVGWKSRVGTVKPAFDAAAKGAGVDKPDAAFARRFYDQVIPHIYDRFDGPAMLPLVAPRPMLVINGDTDDKTPVPGVQLAADMARGAYKEKLVPGKFDLIVQEKTGHKVNADSMDRAAKWFEKWLKE